VCYIAIKMDKKIFNLIIVIIIKYRGKCGFWQGFVARGGRLASRGAEAEYVIRRLLFRLCESQIYLLKISVLDAQALHYSIKIVFAIPESISITDFQCALFRPCRRLFR
jgi:hypothetical protein